MNGALTGATYALVAVGLVLIFSVMRAINFAHGEYYMLGALIAWTGLEALRLPYPLAIVFSAVVTALLGLAVSRALMERRCPVRNSWPRCSSAASGMERC